MVSWAKADGVEMPRPFAVYKDVMDVTRHKSMLVQADNAAQISDRGHPLFLFFSQNSTPSGAGTLIPAW
jgi:hypothetical protein